MKVMTIIIIVPIYGYGDGDGLNYPFINLYFRFSSSLKYASFDL